MLTLRYGYSTWQDACDKQPFSPGIGSLGFSPNYTNALSQTDVFPELLFDDVVDVGGWGAIPNRWNSPYTFNATLSKLWGNHSLKAGADLRKMGVDDGVRHPDGRLVHLRSSASPATTASAGTSWPACCSARRCRARCRSTTARSSGSPSTTAPTSRTTGGSSQRLTVNFGVRLEHEDGLREVENRQAVAFDESWSVR